MSVSGESFESIHDGLLSSSLNSGGTHAGQPVPGRFVILHHTLPGSEHWDLMLEHGEVLLTWQLPAVPDRPERFPMAARRIGDHRKAYLDYEGPVSGNRGIVRQVGRGIATISELSEKACRFRLESSLISGCFVMEHGSGADWTLRVIYKGG